MSWALNRSAYGQVAFYAENTEIAEKTRLGELWNGIQFAG